MSKLLEYIYLVNNVQHCSTTLEKKNQAENLELDDKSIRNVQHDDNEEDLDAHLDPVDPEDLAKLEKEIEELEAKESGLVHHLNSLEQFLFKEKQFDWNQGKKKVFFNESETSEESGTPSMKHLNMNTGFFY